jgi:DNA-directed RNA polymerase subunit RPC12/RpoP
MSVQAGASVGGQQFKCPNCSGAMEFDASVQALRCQYCKHTMAPPQAQAQVAPGAGVFGQAAAQMGPPPALGPREIPLHEGLTRAPKGLGTQVHAVQCKECGATVNLQPNDRTAACTYCASTMVLEVAADPNLITPESLVPFQVAKDKATEAFKGWLHGLWFRPSNLRKMARLEQIVGVYVPYWTFDAWVQSQWTAERGHYYYETETYEAYENGETVVRTRQVQRTEWESAWGSRQDHYDDVLVCASKGLPAELVEGMSTFNTKALVGYNPGFLAGWRAESYAVDLPNAWVTGQSKIVKSQQSRCSGDVGGDTHRHLQVQNHFTNETFKHVLLPVYVAAYRYQGKPFRFLVNGQTGEVVGKAPYSVWKILGLILAFVAVAVAAWFIFQYTQDNGGTGSRTPTTHEVRVAHARAGSGVPARVDACGPRARAPWAPLAGPVGPARPPATARRS